MKFPNFMFEGGRKQKTTRGPEDDKFFFLFKILLKPGSKNPTRLWENFLSGS